jgi:sugar phosphate isomerase/epimerase
MPATFADDVAVYGQASCPAMEVWLTKLEDHLQNHSSADTLKLLEDSQMTIAAAAYQGGLLLAQGQERQIHYDHFKRRLDLCQRFGIETLLVVADFTGRIEQDNLDQAVGSLAEAAQWAAGFNVRLGLEFRGSATFCSSLDTALALVERCGEPNVGINLDVFHYYTGPSKFEDLKRLTPANLAHVQVSDLAGVPREMATDRDRVLPGDGDFALDAIMAQLRSIGYDRWISLELFNPTLWQIKANQVVELGMKALRRLVEKA